MDVDHGQLVYQSPKDFPVVVDRSYGLPTTRERVGRPDGRPELVASAILLESGGTPTRSTNHPARSMKDPTVRGVVHLIEETKTFGQKGFRKRLVVLQGRRPRSRTTSRWSS